ncbi:MAG: MBL fold hydrolase [Isosphaeraceae bacterium]|jgi:glyoxylase-like metal-dependent hydrolase (beta-lactamase superfamily II)/rhodanese-related sulfurtransferase|nr:MAG: MBL fold hydrolase [Isosphaeraceae bacterium]
MILKQYYLGCLAHASYLIADETSKVAAIVDPQRDIDQYLADAQERGLTIRYVFLTHFHADFLAGHIELRNRTGAEIVLGARAQAEFAFRPVRDGDSITLGPEVRLVIWETPGHTPEGISILVYDAAKPDIPYAVLTGDTLFIGDVGRPDLLASIGVTAEELGQMLYESIQRLKQLPDETLVYPAHGAGSLCGKQLSNETVSTIGQQKRYNYALQPMSKQKFLELVTADQPEAPAYFLHDAIANRQERPDLDTTLAQTVRPLPLDEVLRLRDSGAQILDVREAPDFEAAHLAGSINIGLRGQYASWAGTILNKEQPIVVIADPGDQNEAIIRLGRIGFDHVAGFLDGGMSALADHPELLATTTRITALALAERLAEPNPPTVLDVRTDKEREAGQIDGSAHIPLNQLPKRLAEVPPGPLVVHCQGGYRSAIAASLLQRAGRTDVMDLVGGYKAWEASHQPVPNA